MCFVHCFYLHGPMGGGVERGHGIIYLHTTMQGGLRDVLELMHLYRTQDFCVLSNFNCGTKFWSWILLTPLPPKCYFGVLANANFGKNSSFISYSGVQAKQLIFCLKLCLTPDTIIMITHAFQVHLSRTDTFIPNKEGITVDPHGTIAKQPVMAADETIGTAVTHDI